MKSLLRLVPTFAALALPLMLLECGQGNPTNPLIDGQPPVAGGTSGNSTITVTVVASRNDLSADGVDSVTLTATVLDASGKRVQSGSVGWTLQSQDYTGSTGKVSSTPTNLSNGTSTTGYVAPQLDFVPVGANVIVRAAFSIPGNPQGSPVGATTLLLRAKGTTGTSGSGPTGAPVKPTITAVTPLEIKTDAVPASEVIVQGTNFDQTSQVLILASNKLVTISPTFFSSEQIRFTVPVSLNKSPGAATLFVSAPGNLLSDGFPVTLITGGVAGTCDNGPTLGSVLPLQIEVNKSSKLVLLGDNFNVKTNGQGNVTFVSDFFNGNIVKVFPSGSDINRLEVTAPTSSKSGTATIFVTNDDGCISGQLTVQYVSNNINAPVITSLTPSNGPASGETNVTVSGSNFAATDSVVFAAAQIVTDVNDICTGDGLPLCVNNQCILKESRGTCIINGTSYDPFKFIGPGQLEIVAPNVGASGASDVIIQTSNASSSNVVTYTFNPASSALRPEISSIDPGGYSGDGCCSDGLSFIIFGKNFRTCSSVIFQFSSDIYEVLPTPDLSDCNEKRGAPDKPSPRQRLISILPPDGMSINCSSRPDLVPFNSMAAPGTYEHDRICYGGTNSPYAAGRVGTLTGSAPDDFVNGGAVQWVSDQEIRVLFSPEWRLPCSTSFQGSIYISNDPGRGIAGDATSAPARVTYANTIECPTPTPDPTITTSSPVSSSCLGTPTAPRFTVLGTGFDQGAVSVQFGAGNPASGLSVSPTSISGDIPASTPAVCSLVCPAASVCPPVSFQCTVDIIVTVGGKTITKAAGFTYLSATSPGCS